jgi:hypothetical protein
MNRYKKHSVKMLDEVQDEDQDDTITTCKGLSFEDCQLNILRDAMDNAEKNLSKRVAQSPVVKNIFKIIEQFIASHKMMIYGGTAINNILPPKLKFYNTDIDVPDYDVNYGVEESWGWQQLTDSEHSEYLQAEAMASHLGQFIHKHGKLTELRKELPGIPQVEWFSVKDGEKSPIKVTKHHVSGGLMILHEEIAELHRTYEQRVNYYKAKVKNLTSDENARIQKENADNAAKFLKLEKELNEKYKMALDAYNGEVLRLTMEFNSQRELKIKETAALRINVDSRFQHIVDMFITADK